jgi:filamentous hemagglutinin family protein
MANQTVPARSRTSVGRDSSLRLKIRLGLGVITCAALTGVSGAALAQTLPTGGSVAAGSASISSPRAGTLNINQSSNQAIVNWQSFSVGTGGTVNFNQPGASSATLNRVTGSTPSSIAGTINAPGTVLLVNPNGIAITKSGVINTGSFAASTLDIKNEDFLAGKYKFTGNGSSATVTNAGRINVSDGGFAALLGGRVANDGVITARLGKVGLASGEMITLDMSGDGFVSVAVPSNQLGNLRDGTGKALVTNKGRIVADGGTVFLSAATASTLLRDAVNVPGSIRANSVGTSNGRIVIGGGTGGRVNVTASLRREARPQVHQAGASTFPAPRSRWPQPGSTHRARPAAGKSASAAMRRGQAISSMPSRSRSIRRPSSAPTRSTRAMAAPSLHGRMG